MRTLATAVVAAMIATAASVGLAAADETVTVYKSPLCGCCGDWIDHITAAGFTVTAVDTEAMDTVQSLLGVPAEMASCHTALVGGYVVEGHVPAEAMMRLLAEKPKAAGIAVPGMPLGSPGMEGSGITEPFAVMLFSRNGGSEVFESYGQ